MRAVASRPYMPGYGTKGPDEGTGLLAWSWAEEQLDNAKNYWLATNGPQGQPHLSCVWGVWDGENLLFSCGADSRKARNLRRDSQCTVSTEGASNPVIIEGMALLVPDIEGRRPMLTAMNAKYETNISEEFLAPGANCVFAVRPVKAFGLRHDDFAGSPTRWVFAEE